MERRDRGMKGKRASGPLAYESEFHITITLGEVLDGLQQAGYVEILRAMAQEADGLYGKGVGDRLRVCAEEVERMVEDYI